MFFGPASSAQLGLRFSLLAKEIGGPNRHHDAHDAGSWGVAGTSKCFINPNKMLKLRAVGRVCVCGCKYQSW